MMMNSCLSRTSGRSVRRLWWSPYQSGCPCARTSWWPASPEYCCSPTRDTCCPSTYKHTRLASLLARGSWVFLLWKVSVYQGLRRSRASENLLLRTRLRAMVHSSIDVRRSILDALNTQTHTRFILIHEHPDCEGWSDAILTLGCGRKHLQNSPERQRTQTPQKYNTRHTRELLSALRSHDRLYF